MGKETIELMKVCKPEHSIHCDAFWKRYHFTPCYFPVVPQMIPEIRSFPLQL